MGRFLYSQGYFISPLCRYSSSNWDLYSVCMKLLSRLLNSAVNDDLRAVFHIFSSSLHKFMEHRNGMYNLLTDITKQGPTICAAPGVGSGSGRKYSPHHTGTLATRGSSAQLRLGRIRGNLGGSGSLARLVIKGFSSCEGIYNRAARRPPGPYSYLLRRQNIRNVVRD